MKRYLRPEVKRGFHIFIYACFFLLSIYNIIQAPELSTKLFFALIMVIFLTFACLAEYLEYLSEQSIKALNYECNPKKSVDIYNRLQSLDIFKAYKKRRILYDLLYYSAIQDFDAVQNHIEQYPGFFKSNLDARFIALVNQFVAAIHTNKKTQAKKLYLELTHLKSFNEQQTSKKKKVNPLYNWDELEALHYYGLEQFDKACRSYEKVNPAYMNNKEKSQYYYFYYKSLKEIHEVEKANEILTLLNQVKGNLPYES